ncbi:MAG TPA: hypothetical protein VFB44_10895 [Thermoleophilaceae bacterium]|nr:hypothetical protein [Thermoleophilaceae bacterium]
MAGSSLRDAYVELLLDRVRQESFPNPDHLDRIEACVQSGDQLREYVEMLLDRASALSHPSTDILNRIERILQATS